MNAFAHMHDTGRARRPMAFRRRGRHGPGTPAALPYGIQTWDTGAKAHLVVASGELDLHAAGSMRNTLMSLVARGHVHLVIDMSAVTFLDSAMIGVLAAHVRRAREEGGSLVIACSNENVLGTLEVAGIFREMQIVDAVSDALIEKVAVLPHPHEQSKLLRAPATHALHLSPDASELALARGFAVAAARRAGFDPRRQYDLAVASNEAVANAILHGRPCPSGAIEMWADEGREALTVGVRDGGDFVFEAPSTDPLREGGRGLRLMSQTVDETSVNRENGLTVVRLSLRR